jgi:hypothetical protein
MLVRVRHSAHSNLFPNLVDVIVPETASDVRRFERPKNHATRTVPLAQPDELVKVGPLDPPPRMLRGDNSTRDCRGAPIAKQGKASCS